MTDTKYITEQRFTNSGKLLILLTVFITSLCTSVLIGGKIVGFLGLTFSATAITYALTFPMTDTIAEVWGRKKATQIVLVGLIATVLTFIFTQIAIYLPSASFWMGQESFMATFGLVPRIVIGGIIAYTISQYHDIAAFHYWKKWTKGKHLWWRNNASTWVSQLIDTIIFITIAFAGVVPVGGLLTMVFGQYLVKMVIAVVDTPVVYLLVNWAKK